MGEEEKKPVEEKKGEEAVKKEEDQKEKKEGEGKPAAVPAAAEAAKEKPPSTEAAEKKGGDGSKEATPPPPPPQEIVLKVFMHCEGCARKVKRSLKGFPGVEDIITDCKTHKVVVKGEKADPVKVLERVQRKSHRKVELLSPIPKPPAVEEKPKEEEKPKPEEKKEEPKVITVVLKVHMHCDACAMEMKKRILRMKGVESAEPDLKSSQVSVTGVFDPQSLVNHVHKRTGKQAEIVAPEPEKKEGEGKGKDSKEEKKPEEGEKEKKDEADTEKEKKNGEEGKAEEDSSKLEFKKNEFYYYPQYYPPKYVIPGMDAYPPQIFSDENPNACSVM